MSTTTVKQGKSKNNAPLKKVTFGNYEQKSFHKDVKERVNAYFSSDNISKNANKEMLFKTIFILLGWTTTYLVIIFNLVNPLSMFILDWHEHRP